MGKSNSNPKSVQTEEAEKTLKVIPLRRKIKTDSLGDQKSVWLSTVEDVVQHSIQMLRKRTKNNLYLSGIRDLESTLFCKSLIKSRAEWHKKNDGREVPLELDLFANPVGLVAFQVHNRKYSCIKYPVDPEDEEDAVTLIYEKAIQALEKVFSSNRVNIKAEPTSP